MQTDRVLSAAFILAWFAALFEGMSWALFVHFPGYLQELGASEVMIGIIVGTWALSSVLIRPWVGKASDTRGRRPLIIAGNIINVTSLGLYLTVSALGPWVFIVRLIHGLGVGILFPSLFTYAADVVPPARRTEGLALFGVSGLLPIALGGLIGDMILRAAGFTELFLAATGFALVALVLSLPLAETAPRGLADSEHRLGFFGAVKEPSLGPVWLVTGVFSVVLIAYFVFLKTFIVETGIGTVGLFFGFYALTAILLRLFFGWLPDRVGMRRVLYPAMASLALGFVVLALARSASSVAAAGVLSGVGHGFGFPILMALVVTRAPMADRGSAVAVFTAEFDVGLLVGGPLLGFVIAWLGYPAMFLTCSALTIAGAAAFSWWDGVVRSREVVVQS